MKTTFNKNSLLFLMLVFINCDVHALIKERVFVLETGQSEAVETDVIKNKYHFVFSDNPFKVLEMAAKNGDYALIPIKASFGKRHLLESALRRYKIEEVKLGLMKKSNNSYWAIVKVKEQNFKEYRRRVKILMNNLAVTLKNGKVLTESQFSKVIASDFQKVFQGLIQLVGKRLDLMPHVALIKWKQGKGIEDTGQEERVLEKVSQEAIQRGISPEIVKAFFSNQFTLAKEIQHFKIAKLSKETSTSNTMDFVYSLESLRVEISKISNEILELLPVIVNEYKKYLLSEADVQKMIEKEFYQKERALSFPLEQVKKINNSFKDLILSIERAQ